MTDNNGKLSQRDTKTMNDTKNIGLGIGGNGYHQQNVNLQDKNGKIINLH